MKAYVLQMTSTPSVDANFNFIEQQLLSAANDLKGSIVVLPECFARFGGRDLDNLEIVEEIGQGPIQVRLAELAVRFGVYLVAGSMPTKSADKSKFCASCLVFSPEGTLVADYQKIHLFDVEVNDNTGNYVESNSTEPGTKVVTFDTEWGRIGVAICYDLRFPGLFEALRQAGAMAVVLPSAFTQKTGEAHWQPLLQARAIENQFYMIASNQNGVHQNGRETYGHSMIVSPWGQILCDAKGENGLLGTELSDGEVQVIRKKMPVVSHNRFPARIINATDSN